MSLDFTKVDSVQNMELMIKRCIVQSPIDPGQYQIKYRRFILMPDLYQDFLARLKQRLIELDYGNLRDRTRKVEVLSCQEALNHIDHKIKSSIDQGAKILMGGQRMIGFDQYYLPTILYDVTSEMICWDQEILGPVMVVAKGSL